MRFSVRVHNRFICFLFLPRRKCSDWVFALRISHDRSQESICSSPSYKVFSTISFVRKNFKIEICKICLGEWVVVLYSYFVLLYCTNLWDTIQSHFMYIFYTFILYSSVQCTRNFCLRPLNQVFIFPVFVLNWNSPRFFARTESFLLGVIKFAR